MLSVVLPAYNEEQMIPIAAGRISGILEKEAIPYEIIFVNDGSADHSWESIEKCAGERSTVRGISFSRNFGKEAAIFAGLGAARGECCVVLDCDLQHPPEKIVEMYSLWKEGYEVIEGIKSDRGKESAAHKVAAKSFYKLISKATKVDMSSASDFKMLDRKAVDAILSVPEKDAFFRAMSSWVGFKTTSVSYEVQEREAGESKWSTWTLVRYAFRNISSFSTAPMQVVTIFGVLTFLLSIVLGIVSIVQKLNGTGLAGFPTVIIFMGVIGSIIMISLGIIGYYIAKIYEEVKGRPKYIISRRAGEEKREENDGK